MVLAACSSDSVCLVGIRWPLQYNKRTWDAMMHEARDVCHHWIAHVLPLYALLFPKDAASSASQFVMCVRNMSLFRAAEEKAVTVHMQGADMRSCGLSNDLGLLYLVPGNNFAGLALSVYYTFPKIHHR